MAIELNKEQARIVVSAHDTKQVEFMRDWISDVELQWRFLPGKSKSSHGSDWTDIASDTPVIQFGHPDYEFRRKPKPVTVTIQHWVVVDFMLGKSHIHSDHEKAKALFNRILKAGHKAQILEINEKATTCL